MLRFEKHYYGLDHISIALIYTQLFLNTNKHLQITS